MAGPEWTLVWNAAIGIGTLIYTVKAAAAITPFDASLILQRLVGYPTLLSGSVCQPRQPAGCDSRGEILRIHREDGKQVGRLLSVTAVFNDGRIIGAITVAAGVVPALPTLYPNPFNADTAICFDLPWALQVDLDVFDPLGRRISLPLVRRYVCRHATRPAGTAAMPTAPWFGTGVYLYRLRLGDRLSEAAAEHQVRRMLMVK